MEECRDGKHHHQPSGPLSAHESRIAGAAPVQPLRPSATLLQCRGTYTPCAGTPRALVVNARQSVFRLRRFRRSRELSLAGGSRVRLSAARPRGMIRTKRLCSTTYGPRLPGAFGGSSIGTGAGSLGGVSGVSSSSSRLRSGGGGGRSSARARMAILFATELPPRTRLRPVGREDRPVRGCFVYRQSDLLNTHNVQVRALAQLSASRASE